MTIQEKNGRNSLKNKVYRATKIFLLPKARWAEMGSTFHKISLPITESSSVFDMFEGYYSKVLLEGKGVWGPLRGSVPDPRKWPI